MFILVLNCYSLVTVQSQIKNNFITFYIIKIMKLLHFFPKHGTICIFRIFTQLHLNFSNISFLLLGVDNKNRVSEN